MTEIDDKHAALGGAAGFLGPAVAAEVQALGSGRRRQFQHGWIYWSPETGAHEVHGDILAHWHRLGAEQPDPGLGYPLTDESPAEGLGRFNHFQNGSIYWTPTTGAHAVFSPIRTYWSQMRWERGLLGFPVSDPYEAWLDDNAPYTVQEFQGGWVDHPVSDSSFASLRMVRKSSGSSPLMRAVLRFIRVSDENGNNTAPLNGIANYIREANEIFAAAGIRFWTDGNVLSLRSTRVAETEGSWQPTWEAVKALCNGYAAQERAIMVFVRGSTNMGGYSGSDIDFIVMPPFSDKKAFGKHGGWLFAHEMGHYLGLPHTCGPEFQTAKQAENRLLSGLDPDAFDNDRGVVSDTPPDPMINELKYSRDIRSVRLGTQAFALARENVMSYWARAPEAERGPVARLSADQIRVVRDTLRQRAARHLTVAEQASDPDCRAISTHIMSRNALLPQADSSNADLLREQDLHGIDEHEIQYRRQRCAVGPRPPRPPRPPQFAGPNVPPVDP